MNTLRQLRRPMLALPALGGLLLGLAACGSIEGDVHAAAASLRARLPEMVRVPAEVGVLAVEGCAERVRAGDVVLAVDRTPDLAAVWQGDAVGCVDTVDALAAEAVRLAELDRLEGRGAWDTLPLDLLVVGPSGEPAVERWSTAAAEAPRVASAASEPAEEDADAPPPTAGDPFPQPSDPPPTGGDPFPQPSEPPPTAGDPFPQPSAPSPSGGDPFPQPSRPVAGDPFPQPSSPPPPPQEPPPPSGSATSGTTAPAGAGTSSSTRSSAKAQAEAQAAMGQAMTSARTWVSTR